MKKPHLMNMNSTTTRPVIRQAARLRSVLLGACLLSACSQISGDHVQGTMALSDGRILKATGSGPDVNMDWKCLKEDAVVQLTGHPLPASTPKSDCYMTVLITTKSSDASRAVTTYLARSGALQSQAATIALLARRVATSASAEATSAGPRTVVAANAAAPAVAADAPPPVPSIPDTSPTASVVNSVAATAALAPDSSTIQAAASSLGPLLSPATKHAVQQQLESMSVQVPDPSLADRLHQAADQIGQAE